MANKFYKNPLFLFLVKALSLYILWYLLYDLWLNPMGDLDLMVIDNLIRSSYFVLNLFNFPLIADYPYDPSFRTFGLDGTHGVWIGDPCNGISVFALFTGFIIAYPGSFIKKLWYIPLGILIIHSLNILRLCALSLLQLYAPDSLEFNHTYTFTAIIYGCIFGLWYLWTTKLSGESIKK